MGGHKFQSFGPEGWDGIWTIIEVDDEAIGFVIVLHVVEDIVIDVAEEAEVDLR